jgi:uncharacterized protein DUF6166
MNSYCVQAITMAGRGLEDYTTILVSSSLRFEIITGVFQGEHLGGMEDIMICMDNSLARQPLNPRLDLWSHRPTGFEWGYPGSGQAQFPETIKFQNAGLRINGAVEPHSSAGIFKKLTKLWRKQWNDTPSSRHSPFCLASP